MKRKTRVQDKECVTCGEDITGSKSDYCVECRRELLRRNRYDKYQKMPLNEGNRARRLPVGYADNPQIFDDDY